MRLVLIRHGQTDSNTSGALDTAWPGRQLNETGLAQAKALPKKYRELVGQRPARIHSSFILRAQQTAAPLAADQEQLITIDPGLAEISAGDLEMSTAGPDTQEYLSCCISWASGDLERRMPGGETGVEVLSRFDAAISRLCKGLGDEEVAVAVIHGAVMRVWGANRLAGLELGLLAQFPCHNASLTLAGGSPEDGWKAKLWSDHPLEYWPVDPQATPRTSLEAQQQLSSQIYD